MIDCFAEVAFVAFEGELGAAFDDRGVVAREVVFAEQLSDFDFDQLEQLGVVDHVDFVQVHDDVGHADLAREQDVLSGLRHRAVGGDTTRMAPSIWAAPVIMFLM